MIAVRSLSAAEAAVEVPALAAIHVDCVEGNASVSFLRPFGQVRAEAFWREVAGDVAAGRTALLLATLHGAPVGTAQLWLDTPENQPHRAEVKKVLVHRAARGRGVGAALMRQIETCARAQGRTLLMLDTVAGWAGDRLYARLGWTCFGQVPGYALLPDGGTCDVNFYFKILD